MIKEKFKTDETLFHKNTSLIAHEHTGRKDFKFTYETISNATRAIRPRYIRVA